MIRATTPTHTFTIDANNLDLSTAQNIRLTYVQNGTTILEKNKNDVSIDGNTLTYVLTQEDTLAFNAAIPVEIQVTIKTSEGVVLKTGIVTIRADRALNTEVFHDAD
jgi:archaellum component FlaF (FlaF/FlaG flagellin family)